MKKLKMFESVIGKEIKYGRSQTGYQLDREINASCKNKTGSFNFIRYSPNFKSYSVTINGLDCNIKNITFEKEEDKRDIEELFGITLG